MTNVNLPVRPTESRVGRSNQRYNSETGARMVAGCICLNETKDKVIMISSSSKTDKWVLPKGGIELDETDDFVVTAVRETWEESGVEGRITEKLPVVYDARGKSAPVLKGEFDPKVQIPKTEYHFYELIVDELSQTWPESNSRQRRWCTYSEAKHELLKAKRSELVNVLNSSSIIKDAPNDNIDEY
ncbi:Diadenosine and Diphosphoinositol polyphosphate Phosphohydrolase [Scheffersomyces amazonensis]|uniref:Diadenosine and Diphosphoinositol polyphosphate Phosphohydrolase n=1 Tax=Scheffersomyces amazonensis TaxID=1078765 RepID=UPI00315C64BD